jgi:thiol:disulfide interchange protein DsbD
MQRLIICFLTVLIVGSPHGTHAADFGAASATADANSSINQNPLTASVKISPERVGIGGTAEFIIDVNLADDYHAYLDRFKITVDEPEGLKLDRLRIEPTVEFMDTVSKKMKQGVHGHATIRALFEVPEDFKQSRYAAKLSLTYQACTSDHCLFPKTIALEAPFEVTSGVETSGPMPEQSIRPHLIETSEFEKALRRGTLPALLFVFVVGFLTSLTPCIYPMIPITLAVLGARSRGHNKRRSLALSVTYVLGIAMTYSLMGVIAASTGALFGSALSNAYVVSALALIFAAMGLSMFGLYDIQPPAFIRNRLGHAKTGKGYVGAFLTGLLAGVVASPCIGPVLVSVLAYIARTQDRVLGFVFLFTFALGMGVLFIVLGVSSSMMHRMPKAGPWMENIKYLFGSIMIGMALYYVAPVYPPWLFRLVLGFALILVASLLGAFEANHKLTLTGRLRKGVMQAIFFIGVAFAAAGALEKAGVSLSNTALGEGGSSQNSSAQNDAPSYPQLAWQPFTQAKLEAARDERRPVIIDFSAEWCVACKELEHDTFVDPRVRGLSDQFVLLKVDATNDSPALDVLKDKFRVMGLPTILFFDIKGKLREDLTLTGFENADMFLTRMNSALGQATAQ